MVIRITPVPIQMYLRYWWNENVFFLHHSNIIDKQMDNVHFLFFSSGGLTSPINYYRASRWYTGMQHLPSLTIKMPTLMVWGKKDAYLEFGIAELSSKYCKDLTLQPIEASGHWVQQECPKQTNLFMREFLTGKKFE